MSKKNKVIPIAFVDDYAPFRNLLSEKIEQLPNGFRIYQYKDGKDFVTRFPKENYTPSIVLMDIRMVNMNGYETTAWIKKKYPSVPVLAFSDLNSADVMVELVKCGANGYLSKNDCTPLAGLLKAMEEVIEGKLYNLDPKMVSYIKKRLAMPRKELEVGEESLTACQWEVIRYISSDKTYKESANELFISLDTYKSRLKKVFEKLELKSSNELYEWANKRGIIKK